MESSRYRPVPVGTTHSAFQIFAFNPKTGVMVVEPKIITALGVDDARSQLILEIGDIKKIRKLELVVTPF